MDGRSGAEQVQTIPWGNTERRSEKSLWTKLKYAIITNKKKDAASIKENFQESE